VVNIVALVLCLSGISFLVAAVQTQAQAQSQEKGKR